MYDKLEQLELKQEKILGFRNMQEKLEKSLFFWFRKYDSFLGMGINRVQGAFCSDQMSHKPVRKVLYLEVFRAFKFLSDKSQPTQKNLLGETAKLAAELASYLEKASERENTVLNH